MKALSLWQPWATAIARGSKRIETRRWATDYRGPLAIHAAKRMVKSEMLDFGCRWNWCGALGWVLEDIRPVEPPFPCRGARGLFEISKEEAT